MKTEIVKAKITKNKTLEVGFTRHEDNDTQTEVSEKHDNIVHPDLEAAFQKLAPHLILLTDLREADKIGSGRNQVKIEAVTPDMFDKFTIGSFSIGGDGEGVTISGRKQLNASQVFNINTPFQKYDDEMSDYKYGSELASDIEACIYEVEQYLKGKCAAKQTEMTFEPEQKEEEQAA